MTINTTNGSVFVPEIWSKEVLNFSNSNFIMSNLVTRKDSEVQNGDVIHFPKIWGFTAKDKINGQDVQDNEDPTNGSVSILIDKHKTVKFILEDKLMIQANSGYDLRKDYTENAGLAISEAIDSDLLNLATWFSNSVWTYASSIDEDVILSAKLKLDMAGAPRVWRSFVISPTQENALLKIDKFVRQDSIWVNDSIKNWMIWRIYWFEVYTTNQVKTIWGETNNLAFHKSAIALCMQLAPRVQSEYDLNKLAWKIVIDTIYWVGEIEDSYWVLVKSN